MPPLTLPPLAPIANKESFIERFGDWISGIFSTADDVYNQLTDDEKRAAVWGSGLIHVIDQNITAAPDDVKTLIQAAFPDLSIDVVHGFLDELRSRVDTLQSEIPLTLEDAIVWAQKYLASYHGTGTTLDIIRSTAASILQTLLSPTTPIQKFISIGLTIFHLIVKPHVAAVTATINANLAASLPEPIAPAPLVPGTPEFEAAVQAEVARRFNGNG